MQRLGLVAAQLAPRPGARQALGRVVTADDLPGDGWSVLDERTWRTGFSGPATEWGRRARAARSVTAWRSFQGASAKQSCWVQVMPLASEADALDSLDGVWDRMLRNLRATVRVVQEQDMEMGALPWAGKVRAREQRTAGRVNGPDGEGVARMLAAACGTRVIIVASSGTPEWTWEQVTAVAARQAELLGA